MENGDAAETGLNESYLAHSYVAMEGKWLHSDSFLVRYMKLRVV